MSPIILNKIQKTALRHKLKKILKIIIQNMLPPFLLYYLI